MHNRHKIFILSSQFVNVEKAVSFELRASSWTQKFGKALILLINRSLKCLYACIIVTTPENKANLKPRRHARSSQLKARSCFTKLLSRKILIKLVLRFYTTNW